MQVNHKIYLLENFFLDFAANILRFRLNLVQTNKNFIFLFELFLKCHPANVWEMCWSKRLRQFVVSVNRVGFSWLKLRLTMTV